MNEILVLRTLGVLMLLPWCAIFSIVSLDEWFVSRLLIVILFFLLGTILTPPEIAAVFGALSIAFAGGLVLLVSYVDRRQTNQGDQALNHAANPDEAPEADPPPDALWPPEDAFSDDQPEK